MTPVASDLATFLVSTWASRPGVLTDGLPVLTLGGNVFHGPVRIVDEYIPATAVFIQATGGPRADDIIGSSHNGYRYEQCQVRIRSAAEAYENGVLLAATVRERLNFVYPSGYIDVRVLEAHPLVLGADDAGQYEWSINVEAWRRES